MSIPRERLSSLFLGANAQNVFVMVAPAGYGKTSLLREYLERDPYAVYISLTGRHGPQEFIRALVASLASQSLRSLGAMLQRSPAPDDEQLRGWLNGRLGSLSGSVVLDDLHEIGNDPTTIALLTGAIASTRNRVRWILSAREAPSLPFGSWIANGWMTLPITDVDLAFNDDETRALAGEIGFTISDDQLRSLHQETQGWPIGVRMTLDLWRRTATPALPAARTRAALLRIIEDEIWAKLPGPLQQVAYACALLPRTTVAAVDAAVPDDPTALKGLADHVPFVHIDPAGNVTLHELFRDFVLGKLRATRSDSALEVRLAAALVQAHDLAGAAHLLASAGAFPELHTLLAKHAFDMIEVGDRAPVRTALDKLSKNGYADDPVVLAVRAAFQQADGSAANAASSYRRALERGLPESLHAETALRLALVLVASGEPTEALAVLAPILADPSIAAEKRTEMTSVCATVYAAGGDPSAARRAIASVEQSLRAAPPATRAKALQRLGYAACYNGDLELAIGYSMDAVQLAEELGLDQFAAFAYSTLYSATAMLDSDSRRALFFARGQVAAAERAGHLALRVFSLRAVYSLSAERGDVPAAMAADRELAALPDARTYRDALSTRWARALILFVQNDLRRAHAAIAALPEEGLSPPERAYRSAALALFLLLDGRRDEAVAAVERPPLVHAADDYFSKRYATFAHVISGIVLWAADRRAQARRTVRLDLSSFSERDSRLFGTFLELIQMPHPLPNSADVEPLCLCLEQMDRHAWAMIVRRIAEADASGVSLSAKEIEVLRALYEHGGSTLEIATMLGKSPHTIENQLKSAIRKIGCSGRSEAVAYARKRGLFDRAALPT